MYYYKYVFYKIYTYLKDGNWALYPQIETILIITIFPLSNLLVVLYLLSLFNLYRLDFSFISSNTSKLLIVTFIAVFIFNNLFFYLVSNWKEIIISMRKEKELPRINRILYLYVLFSVVSLCAIYLLGGLFVK